MGEKRDDRVEDLDVPESESDEVKGGLPAVQTSDMPLSLLLASTQVYGVAISASPGRPIPNTNRPPALQGAKTSWRETSKPRGACWAVARPGPDRRRGSAAAERALPTRRTQPETGCAMLSMSEVSGAL